MTDEATDAHDRSTQAPEEDAARDVAEEDKRRTLRLRSRQLVLFAILVGVVGILLVPKLPHPQHVRLHLGAGSSRIVSVTARLGAAGGTETAWEREVRWRFPQGAPPVVDWRFDHADDDVEIEVELESATAHATERAPAALRANEADGARVDLSTSMQRLE